MPKNGGIRPAVEILIKQRFKTFQVGPLPAEIINKALGKKLHAADVRASKAAHSHIVLDHPCDY